MLHRNNKLLAYALMVVMATPQSALAASLAVDGGTQTNVDSAQNSVPVVNIAAPNSDGVSRNTYKDFNVDQHGLILNNSNDVGVSQLGGAMVGNGNLHHGPEANVILNEVTSTHNSSLNGYTEIFGKRAEFILANPNGITCNGCGFINTNRASLITGSELNPNGPVGRFRMGDGNVSIEGMGLNGDNVDYIDIITRAAQIQAQLQAKKRLGVLTGNELYDYRTRTITSNSKSSAPIYSVDASLLGSMYAGRIELVATEEGVGVRTQADVQAGDDLFINSSADLVAANIQAGNDLLIQAKGNINQQGKYTAGGILTMDGEALYLNYLLASKHDLSLTSGAGGIHVKNQVLSSAGTTSITANGGDLMLSSAGSILADGQLGIKAASISNSGTIAGKQDIGITAASLTNAKGAQLHADSTLNLGLSTQLNNAGKIIASGNVALGDPSTNIVTINNNDGWIESGADLTLHANTLNNLNGATVLAARQLDINTRAITNSGTLDGEGSVTIAANTLDNQPGAKIYSAGVQNLAIENRLSNSGSLIANGDLSVSRADGSQLTTITNNGWVESSGDLNLQAQTINNGNVNSMLLATGALQIGANEVDNTGKMNGNLVNINANGLTTYANSAISSNTALDLNLAQVLDNRGTLSALSGLQITTANNTALDSITNNGQIKTAGNAILLAKDVTNGTSGVVLTNQDLNIVAVNLDNSGNLVGKGAFYITADKLNNAVTGEIYAGNPLALTVNSLSNAGKILSQGATNIHAAGNQRLAAFNNNGNIEAAGNISLLANTVTQDASGALLSNADITIDANAMNNGGGLKGKGNVNIQANSINNAAGATLASGNALGITAQDITNGGTINAGGATSLSANTFTNANNAILYAGNPLVLELANSLNNSGQILTQGNIHIATKNGGALASVYNNGWIEGGGAVDVNTAKFTNTANSTLMADTDLTLTVPELVNNGALRGKTTNTINTNDITNNTGATLYAGSALVMNVNNAINNNGDILSGGSIKASRANGTYMASLTNNGWMESKTSSNLLANVINNNANASLLSSGVLSLNAGNITNGGMLSSDGTLALNANNLGNSSGATLYAANALNANILDTITNSGNIFSKGSISLTAANGGWTSSFDNAGKVESATGLTIAAGTVTNRNNAILLGGTALSTNSTTLDNSGTIQGNGDATLSADTITNNATTGRIVVANTLNLFANTSLTNSGKIISNGSMNISKSGGGMMAGFTNNAGAWIQSSGDMAIASSNTDNKGTIYSKQNMTLDSTSFHNSSFLYGKNQVKAAVRTLLNDGNSVVLSDKSINVQASNGVTNYGEITSRGSLTIGVNYTYGGLNNIGGRIQSAGDMQLTAGYIRNVSKLGETTDFIGQKNSPIDRNYTAVDPRTGVRNWTDTINTAAYDAPDVRGLIHSDGNMALTATGARYYPSYIWGRSIPDSSPNIINDESDIYSAQTMTIKARKLDNRAFQLTKAETQSYQSYEKTGTRCAGYMVLGNCLGNGGWVDTYGYVTRYHQVITNTGHTNSTIQAKKKLITKNVGSFVNQIVGGNDGSSNMSATPTSKTDNGNSSDLPSGQQASREGGPIGSALGSGKTGTTAWAGTIAGPAVSDSLSRAKIKSKAKGGTKSANTDPFNQIKLPPKNGGLFTVTAPNSSHPYLVETNPLYTDTTKLYGSKYFLDQVDYHPDQDTTFLGDAYYEQRVIEDQVRAEVGQRYIYHNVSDSNQQYEVLAQQAANERKRLGLQVGRALTQNQVNSLDQDIIWYVNTNIDGHSVLAPQLYLSPATKKAMKTGANIIAADITGNVGDLSNSGNIIASNTIDLNVANDFTNDAGYVKAGSKLAISTGGNFTSRLGTIDSGGDMSLASGNDMTLDDSHISSTGNTKLSAGHDLLLGAEGSQHVTKLDIGGDLAMSSGNNMTFEASEVNVKGKASLDAGNDLIFNALTNTKTTYYHNGNASTTTTTNTVAHLNVGGDLAMTSGNDMTLEGTDVKAGGDASIDAGHDLNIEAVYNTSTSTSTSHHHGMFSSSSSTSTSSSSTAQVASLGIKGNLSMSSGNDTNLEGTDVNVAKNASLDAGNELNLKAAYSTTNSSNSSNSSGMFGASNSGASTSSSSTAKVVKLNVGGNMELSSQQDMTLEGTDVKVGGDGSIYSGGNVNLNAANDTQSYSKSSHSNGAFGLSSSSHSASGSSSNANVTTVTTGVATTDLAGIKVHKNVNESAHSGFGQADTGTQVVDTSAPQSAGSSSTGSLTIRSKGDTTLEGSQISAQGNVSLDTGGSLNVLAAQNTSISTTTSGQKGVIDSKDSTETNSSTTNQLASISSKGDLNTHSGGDTLIMGGKLHADGNVGLSTDGGDISVVAVVDTKDNSKKTHHNDGIYTETTDDGYHHETVQGSSISSGGHLSIDTRGSSNQAGNVLVAGSNVTTGGDLNIGGQNLGDTSLDDAAEASVGNLTVTTVEENNNNWHHQSKTVNGGLGTILAVVGSAVGLKMEVKSSKDHEDGTTKNQSSTVKAAGNLAINTSGDTTIAGSDVTVDGNADISTGGDFNVIAAIDSSHEKDSESKTEMHGMSVEITDSRASIGLDGTQTGHSTTKDHQTVASSSINIGGDMNVSAQGAVAVVGSDVSSDGNMVVDGKKGIKIVNADEVLETTKKDSEGKARLSVGVSNAYWNVAVAHKAWVKAGNATRAAEKALDDFDASISKMKQELADGRVTQADIDARMKDRAQFVANVTAAKINEASKLAAIGSASLAAGASTGMAGFSADVQFETSTTDTITRDKKSTARASSLSSKNGSLVLTSGKDINITGSDVGAAAYLVLNAKNDINIKAAEETETTSSSTKKSNSSYSIGMYGSGTGDQSLSGGVSSDDSHSTAVNHRLSSLMGGAVVMNSGADTNIIGATVDGGSLGMDVGGNLNVASVQDTYTSKNSSSGVNLGMSGGSSGMQPTSFGANAGSGHTDSAIVNQRTSLVGLSGVNINVAKKTTVTSATIAQIGADGKEGDNLSLTTGSLTVNDLKDYSNSNNSSAGLTLGGDSTTIQASDSGHIFKQTGHTVIGQGDIKLTGPDKEIKGDLKRSIDDATTLVVNRDTGGLNMDMTVDHKLLTNKGRKEIVVGLAETGFMTSDLLKAGYTSLTDKKSDLKTFDKEMKYGYQMRMGLKKTADKNETGLNHADANAKDVKEGMQDLADNIAGGKDKGAKVNLYDGTSSTVGTDNTNVDFNKNTSAAGYNKADNNIMVNAAVEDMSSTDDKVTAIGHESFHAAVNQQDISISDDANESMAIYYGKQASTAYDLYSAIDGNSIDVGGKTASQPNWLASHGNESTISQGNNYVHGIDSQNVDACGMGDCAAAAMQSIQQAEGIGLAGGALKNNINKRTITASGLGDELYNDSVAVGDAIRKGLGLYDNSNGNNSEKVVNQAHPDENRTPEGYQPHPDENRTPEGYQPHPDENRTPEGYQPHPNDNDNTSAGGFQAPSDDNQNQTTTTTADDVHFGNIMTNDSAGNNETQTQYHGNDRRNSNAQHNYDIVDKNGNVAKGPLARGRASEARVLDDLGLPKNTQKVTTSEGNAIPDALTRSRSVEIKDCIGVSCTKQIRIQTEAARASGRESVLVTGSKTRVSGPAERAFDRIIRRDDLGPQ